MGKHTESSNDFCPECVNENGNGEPNLNHVISCDESDCCCCCCCSCENSEQENIVENGMQTLTDPERFKKDLMSSLSPLSSSRQPASIQNVLQYIETLTHSGNFLDRYYSLEDFCFDCLRELECECYMNSSPNFDLNNSCTCSECTVEERSITQDPGSGHQNCPDCISDSKTSLSGNPRSRALRRRRNRRHRRRYSQPPLAERTNQWQGQSRHVNVPQEEVVSCNDPKCSGRKYGSEENPKSAVSDDQSCNCEECNPEVPTGQDLSCTCIFPSSSRSRDQNNIPRSVDRPTTQEASDYQTCQFSDCDDCRGAASDNGVTTAARCNDGNCETCSLLQPVTARCNCCTYSGNNLENAAKPATESNPKVPKRSLKFRGSTMGNPLKDGQVSTEPCNCEDCQKNSEYSEDSCDECCNRSSKTRKPGKKR